MRPNTNFFSHIKVFFTDFPKDLSEVINKETKQTEEKEAETASPPEETLFNIEQKVNVEVEKITHSLMVNSFNMNAIEKHFILKYFL